MPRYNWRGEKLNELVSMLHMIINTFCRFTIKCTPLNTYIGFLFVGVGKETLVVTPLMDFVRQKRAEKSGPRVFYIPVNKY